MEKNLISGKIEYKVFFLGHRVDLWDMVVDSYIHPVDGSAN